MQIILKVTTAIGFPPHPQFFLFSERLQSTLKKSIKKLVLHESLPNLLMSESWNFYQTLFFS